jgi:diapolycopene oxygenase
VLRDYVTLQPLETHWRNFFEDGLAFDLCGDRAQQQIELRTKLGADAAADFERFMEYSRELCRIVEEGYFAHGPDSLTDLLKLYGPWRSFAGFDVLRSVDGGVRRFIREPHLIDVMNYFVKYVGSSPYDAPALLNLLPYVQFGYGVWYVQGGMHALARAFEALLSDVGGTIRYGSEVVGVDRSERRITAVRTASGAALPVDILVANMEVTPFYEKVTREPPQVLARQRRFAPSCSGLVLHLGVDRTYPALAHHNVFYSRDARRHFDSIFKHRALSEDPTIYLVAPCKTDASLAPPGCEIIKALPHIPHLDDRGEITDADYAAFRERVLAKLERMGLADLRAHIVVEKTLTPHDIEQLYYSNRGSIYGVVADRWKNLGFKASQRSDRYENLYFVGGSVNPGGGMPMVTLSGQLVRDKIEQDLEAVAAAPLT